MEIRVARTCFALASFALLLGGSSCGSSNSNPGPAIAADAGAPTAAELGQKYKFAPNAVQGWQLDPNDAESFLVLEEGTPTDLFSWMDGGSDEYTNRGCTISVYESLVSTKQELAVIWVMYFGTDANATSMFDNQKSLYMASLPIPNYDASVAIGKIALSVFPTVYAHLGPMFFRMDMSGFADATTVLQAASQILDVFKSKTH